MKRYEQKFNEGITVGEMNRIIKELNKKLVRFNNKYKNVDFGSDSIASAPNTSTFRASRSGFIKVDTSQVLRFPGFNSLCDYVLQIGSLVDEKTSKKAINEYNKIFASILVPQGFEMNKNGSFLHKEKDVAFYYKDTYGTNYSQYGYEICDIRGQKLKVEVNL